MPTNYYITHTEEWTALSSLAQQQTTATTLGMFQATADSATYWSDGNVRAQFIKKDGINPILYFKYIKSKVKALEGIKLDDRLNKIKRASKKAAEAGQDVLSKKFLQSISREVRESQIFAKGITKYIERDDLVKHKQNIRGGHISDTLIKDFTRVIPDDIIASKKKVETVFDDFVIYHYWDEKAEENRTKKQKLTPDEKAKMRDPILFGIIKETNRLYFVADWEDEFCDLTFEEMADVMGKEELTKEITL